MPEPIPFSATPSQIIARQFLIDLEDDGNVDRAKTLHDDASNLALKADRLALKFMANLMETMTSTLMAKHGISDVVARGLLEHGLEHAMDEVEIEVAGRVLADETEAALKSQED